MEARHAWIALVVGLVIVGLWWYFEPKARAAVDVTTATQLRDTTEEGDGVVEFKKITKPGGNEDGGPTVGLRFDAVGPGAGVYYVVVAQGYITGYLGWVRYAGGIEWGVVHPGAEPALRANSAVEMGRMYATVGAEGQVTLRTEAGGGMGLGPGRKLEAPPNAWDLGNTPLRLATGGDKPTGDPTWLEPIVMSADVAIMWTNADNTGRLVPPDILKTGDAFNASAKIWQPTQKWTGTAMVSQPTPLPKMALEPADGGFYVRQAMVSPFTGAPALGYWGYIVNRATGVGSWGLIPADKIDELGQHENMGKLLLEEGPPVRLVAKAEGYEVANGIGGTLGLKPVGAGTLPDLRVWTKN